MKCLVCKKEFKRTTVAKTCSLKCRLMEKIKKTKTCWEWHGVVVNRYGKLRWEGKILSVHRLSYELFVGPIPAGMFVCHTCDNPICMNPAHLWLGTAAENSRDAAKKGKMKGNTGRKLSEATRLKISQNHADHRGSKSCRAKLREEDVINIRQLLNEGYTRRQVAKQFGISIGSIDNIKYRRRWTHI